jgi:hypothetical protein
MMVPPSALEALSAIARTTTSVVPPAVHGQISRIGRDGKLWARTIVGDATIAVAAREVFRKVRRVSFTSAMAAVSFLDFNFFV